MLPWLLVAFGGAIGAVLRYGVSRLTSQMGYSTPVSTFAVNFMGSYVLGILLFSSERSQWLGDKGKVFLSVGILGAFTTMSTFSFESMKLLEEKGWMPFSVNVIGTILLVLLAVILGKVTTTLLFR